MSARNNHVNDVNHPSHYTSGPTHSVCGEVIEAIDVTETMNFNVGNAMKYIWRHKLKGKPLEDLQKARWYIDREIQRFNSEDVGSAYCPTCTGECFPDRV